MKAAALFLIASIAAPQTVLAAPAKIASTDAFGSMRAVVAPALACERTFDAERRKLAEEQRTIDAMPTRTGAEQAQWHAAWETHDAKDRAFKDRRGKVCKSEEAFERLKARLAQMRPDLSPGEVHTFALGFFQDLRRTAEYAADFAAGSNAQQYTPIPAPPAPRSNSGT